MNIKLLERQTADFAKTADTLKNVCRELADLRKVRESVAKGNPATIICGETQDACANFHILARKNRAGLLRELRREQNDCATKVAELCAAATHAIETIVFSLDDVGEV